MNGEPLLFETAGATPSRRKGKRKILAGFLFGAIAAAAIAAYFQVRQARECREAVTVNELTSAGQATSQCLQQVKQTISSRLIAFAQETALDQMFFLHLLVENDPSATEVTEKAAHYQKIMGFSLLSIVDSAGTILSSGHFPASAGNSAAAQLAALSDEPRFIDDNVMGRKVLTLQATVAFTVADSIRFHALGGMIVDSAFLVKLSPRKGVTVLLRQNATVMGMPDIKKISDVNNDHIVINDLRYPALRLPIEGAPGAAPLALIVVLTDRPGQ